MKQSVLSRLALICGGPSTENGISLNSARSVLDHLKGTSIEIVPIFVDEQKQFYRISEGQLYSNTPSDFNFKLNQFAQVLPENILKSVLLSVDLVFPLIHGAFGEDGELQELLEKWRIPFIGATHHCSSWMFPKHQAVMALKENEYLTCPQLVLSEINPESELMIHTFFKMHQLKRAIVKPSVGGSSIGVQSVNSPLDACEAFNKIFVKKLSAQAILEPFITGREFTIVLFQNEKEEPVALIPTEIELSYSENAIFDYRKKYLPTNQATYYTPARFSKTVINCIRLQAEQIFRLFGMRDFVRLDGWVLPNGEIYFTDINPISGLEQNSFFFRQASLIGMSHSQALEYIIKNACRRYGLIYPLLQLEDHFEKKTPVYVLFGNHNAERQVSLMSGTNVWLKLLQSEKFVSTPFFLDCKNDVWQLPYSFNLNHTVEEIYANCILAGRLQDSCDGLIEKIRGYLGLHAAAYNPSLPSQMSLMEFFEYAKRSKAFVFIALHGGIGENGVIQSHLEKYRIPFNGSSAKVSALCMDKYLTGLAIERLNEPKISSLKKLALHLAEFENQSLSDIKVQWKEWCQRLSCEKLIIKPRGDGCSAGIVLLCSAQDFHRYCALYVQRASFIPSGTFSNQFAPIEMSITGDDEYLLESYIETDEIVLDHQTLHMCRKSGWLELTVGVIEENGRYHALNPSITVVQGAILSLEEKFQGGTGINLTPPPVEIISAEATEKIKRLVECAAKGLGIENYARLDIFYNCLEEKIILIEANTLPALTPSTVIYHQGMAEDPPLTPLKLLENIVSSRL